MTASLRTRPLRVVACTDARGRGGAEISLGHLLAALPREVEATVVGVDPEVTAWIARCRPGTRSIVLADGPRGFPAHLRTFSRLRADVIHVSRCVPWACATGTAAALTTPGVRVVTVDQLPLRTTEWGPLWRTRALSLRVDGLVAVGEASARRVEDFYALGRGQVRSIPNGVPDVPLPPPARRNGGPLRVVAVGRLDAMKGHDVLLRAVSRVAGVRLTVLGEGDERGALESLARELGIQDRVELPGWVEDPRSLLPGHHVLSLPSRSEGFPLALLEGMLAALPAVATPVGSVAEAVADGETGILVPPDDAEALAAALVRLRDDPDLAVRLGVRAREVARARFTAERMAEAYLSLWTDLLSRPRAPRLRPPPPRP